MSKNFLANIRKGGLHENLGIPQNEKIPSSKLMIKKGDSSLVKKEKALAKNMRGWKH
jgi:hypothetical protein